MAAAGSASRRKPVGEQPSTSTVVAKVQVVIEALARRGRLGLSALGRETGLAKATVYRTCQELVAWGVVERSGDGYRLGNRLFELGQKVPARRMLRDVALPYLEDLVQASGLTVHFAVPEGHEVSYVERISSRRGESAPSEVAGRMPMHCTATGKCLLAFGPTDLVDEYVVAPLAPLTRYSIADASLLRGELAAVRGHGYAVEREEAVIGYASVAGPVFEARDRLVGAVSLTGSVRRVDVGRVGVMVVATARAISSALDERTSAGDVAGSTAGARQEHQGSAEQRRRDRRDGSRSG